MTDVDAMLRRDPVLCSPPGFGTSRLLPGEICWLREHRPERAAPAE
jgi:hypothetical protein